MVGVLGVVVVLSGCGSDRDLCVDTAVRLVDRDRRCGIETTTFEDYAVALGGWNCDDTGYVRDRTAFIEECIPAIDADECTMNWVLPEACRDQF